MDHFHPAASQGALLDLSSLSLAYLGDAVFELMVRTELALHRRTAPGRLHRAAMAYVTAPHQARMAAALTPLLTEEEADVYRRGRNAAPHSIPKHATRAEYQAATGLEALFGWLYLRGAQDRLEVLFAAACAALREEGE